MAFPFTAVATIGSSLLGGLFGKSGAKKQNEAQALEAQKQRDFQQYNSDTAHQREVKDLRAAGLNPILSGMGGSGASSPGGAQANVVNEMAEMSNSARDISSKLQQNPLITSQVDNLRAENQRIREQTRQLQISNAQQSVLTPLYTEAGSATKAGIDKIKGFLGVEDAGDLVGDVLGAGKHLPGKLANGEISLPNSAFDISRFVGSADSEARKWASGKKGFLKSLIDANKPDKTVHSAKRLTEEAVRLYGLRQLANRNK